MVVGPDPGGLTVDGMDTAACVAGNEGPLEVTPLLLTPICHAAPPGNPGDVVRVSVGATTVYLLPADVDGADEAALRDMVAARGRVADRDDAAP